MVAVNSNRRTASYIAAVIGLAALIGLQLSSNANVDEKYENVLRQLKAELDEAIADGTTGMKKKSQFINHRITVEDKINEDVDDVDSVISPKKRKLEDVDDECQMNNILGPTQIPADANFTNTVIVGYPGADKRTVLRQMEALTTLSGRDSWDMKYLGMTNQPYMKANFPHHEGIWGWEDHADQVLLVVRNIRFTIDEYHDILADIDYAKTWEEATEKIPKLYKGEIYEVLYNAWRDERTMDEIGWYGWLIDYWMEGGIQRDYFDHKLTTPEHWHLLREPELWTYGELQWDVNNCETDGPVTNITYDSICDPELSTFDCHAKLVISAERFMSNETGLTENRKIAMLLNETGGVNEYLTNETTWDCIWDSLIGDNPTGESPGDQEDYIDYRNRNGTATRSHHVSIRHLTKMVMQLTRLINKYSSNDAETGIDWSTHEQAQFLVEILTEHRALVQAELDAKPAEDNWAHPPKTNWVVFPLCGPNAETGRRVWDYDYSDWVPNNGYSGLVMDMFPDSV